MSSLRAHLGQITTSCSQMQEAISILKALKQKELLCVVLSNLAEVQLWRGMWAESTQNAQESFSVITRKSLSSWSRGGADSSLRNLHLNEDCIAKQHDMPKEARISLDIKIPSLSQYRFYPS